MILYREKQKSLNKTKFQIKKTIIISYDPDNTNDKHIIHIKKQVNEDWINIETKTQRK